MNDYVEIRDEDFGDSLYDEPYPNEDIWALSELIQWLFRSAIREEKEVNLYMPSSRMRSLLKDWLDSCTD